MTDSYDEGDKALTTDIANGMLVSVVFDDSQKVVAIYLEEEYKTEDDGVASDAGKVPTSVKDIDEDYGFIYLNGTYGAKNRSDRAASELEGVLANIELDKPRPSTTSTTTAGRMSSPLLLPRMAALRPLTL